MGGVQEYPESWTTPKRRSPSSTTWQESPEGTVHAVVPGSILQGSPLVRPGSSQKRISSTCSRTSWHSCVAWGSVDKGGHDEVSVRCVTDVSLSSPVRKSTGETSSASSQRVSRALNARSPCFLNRFSFARGRAVTPSISVADDAVTPSISHLEGSTQLQ